LIFVADFQEVHWDWKGCSDQLRQRLWEASGHCRCHWPE